eukprot:GGOE01007808.1.p1 GENE.GGOE01007808.1~~GGOE01007808.1.p1  ORF type:complete len:444 (-),score=81.67 GGOE01007808.1:550-1704(-)
MARLQAGLEGNPESPSATAMVPATRQSPQPLPQPPINPARLAEDRGSARGSAAHSSSPPECHRVEEEKERIVLHTPQLLGGPVHHTSRASTVRLAPSTNAPSRHGHSPQCSATTAPALVSPPDPWAKAVCSAAAVAAAIPAHPPQEEEEEEREERPDSGILPGVEATATTPLHVLVNEPVDDVGEGLGDLAAMPSIHVVNQREVSPTTGRWKAGLPQRAPGQCSPPFASSLQVSPTPSPRRHRSHSIGGASAASSGGSLQRRTWSPTHSGGSGDFHSKHSGDSPFLGKGSRTPVHIDGNCTPIELLTTDPFWGDLHATGPLHTPPLPARRRSRALASLTLRDLYRDSKVDQIQLEMEGLDITRLQTEVGRHSPCDSDATDDFGW